MNGEDGNGHVDEGPVPPVAAGGVDAAGGGLGVRREGPVQGEVDPRRAEYQRQLADVQRRRRDALRKVARILGIIAFGLILGGVMLLDDLEFMLDELDGQNIQAEGESKYPKLVTATGARSNLPKPGVEMSDKSTSGEKKHMPAWQKQEAFERKMLFGHGLCAANWTVELARAEEEGNATALAAFAELFMFGDFRENSTKDGCGNIDTPRAIELAKKAAEPPRQLQRMDAEPDLTDWQSRVNALFN